MRIDLTQVSLAAAQAEASNHVVQADQVRRRIEAGNNSPGPSSLASAAADSAPAAISPQPAKPVPLPEPSQLSVSVDDKRNVIYRFTDPNNGELVRQVPPEEILRIMRNIEDLLQESQQKLKVIL